MKWKKRANQSLAIALTFALAFTMNVPFAAWAAEEDPTPTTEQGSEPVSEPSAAQQFDALVAALPAADAVTAGDVDAVTAAQAAYDVLSEADKAQVTASYEKLEAVAAALEALNTPDPLAEGGNTVDLNAVAQVGDATYADLQTAIDAAGDTGATVKLLQSVTASETIGISAGKNLTLDLAGCTLTNSTVTPTVRVKGNLAVVDNGSSQGMIANGKPNSAAGKYDGYVAIVVEGSEGEGASFAISSGKVQGTISVTGNTAYGEGRSPFPAKIAVSGSAVLSTPGKEYGPGVSIRGLGAQLDMTGGHVVCESQFCGIQGNGSFNAANNRDDGGTVINISGGEVKGMTAVYHPQSGTLNVAGGTLEGCTGVEMRAGTLNVSDNATIKGTVEFDSWYDASGATVDGAGIAVSQHTTELPININISGGTISGNKALYEGIVQGGGKDPIAPHVTLAVTGGTLDGTDFGGSAGVAVESQNCTGFITGGTFSTEPDATYIAHGYSAISSGADWSVAANNLAEMTIDGVTATYSDPTAFFAALQGAVNSSIGIKLLSDISIDDVYIPISSGQKVELDFNGYTLAKASGKDPAIKNQGELTLFDSAGNAGGIQAYRSCIRNEGTLTVEAGLYRTSDATGGSAILNATGGSIVVNGGDIQASSFALANQGTAIVNGGSFFNESCSACNPSGWAYTIKSVGGTLEFNGGKVDGVQGALAISGGDAVINGGEFTAHACKTHGAANAFYALYVAGEYQVAKCIVNDGAFVSEGKYAVVLVGNDNENGDGGINAQATSEIRGGTFNATLPDTPALKGAPKTGNPSVSGGAFSSVVEPAYCAEGYIPVKIAEGKYGVALAHAAVGDTKYATLQEAFEAAQTGDTVVLLRDCAEDVTLPVDKGLTLNGNGYAISGKLGGSNVGDVAVKDATFTTAPDVSLAAGKKITFSSCTFDKANGSTKKSPSVTVRNGSPAFKNCSFVSIVGGDQTVGIQTWGAAAAEVSGCTFAGFSGTPITLSNTTGNVTVTNNVIDGWGTAASGEYFQGRAMRLDLNGASTGIKVVVTGNKMVKADFDSAKNESFVKLSGANLTEADVTVTNNYWNGLDPNSATAIADGEAGDATAVSIMQFTKEGETLELYPYFTDEAMTTLATGAGETKTEKEVVVEKLTDVSTTEAAKDAADALVSASQATKDALAQDDVAKQQIAAVETTLTNDTSSKVEATAVEDKAGLGTEVAGAALTAAAVGSTETVKAKVTIEETTLPADKVLPGNAENAIALDVTLDVVNSAGDTVIASDVQPAAPITLKVKIPESITDPDKLVIYHFHGTASEPEVFSVDKGNLAISIENGSRFATLTLSKLSYLVFTESASSSLIDDISGYRSGDASTWTYPTAAPGTVFAGWYTDASLTTPLGKDVVTGPAYARFVNVSETETQKGIITFKGGSLKMTGDPSTSTSLRFGYSFKVPSGTQFVEAGWTVGYEGGAETVNAVAASTVVHDTGMVDANALLTPVANNNYGRAYTSAMYITYETVDGTTVTAVEASPQTRSVGQVARLIVDSPNATLAEKEYAQKLLELVS